MHTAPRNLISSIVLAGVLGTLFALPGTAQEVPGPLDSEDVSAFVSREVQAAMAANHIPGAAVSITQGDRIVFLEGFGYADIAAPAGVDPDRTMFRVASVSKPFVWMSVLQLRDEGLLDIDRDINEYLDFVIDDTFPGQPVTLRHLMTHTAGFEDVNIGASTRSAAEREPLSDTLRRMKPRRVALPGLRTAYSNYGTALAAYIVERAADAPFPEHLETKIFSPLGMTRTTMRQPPYTEGAHLAVGYSGDGDTLSPVAFEHMNLYPNGALSTTASDMARFAIAQMTDGGLALVLSPESRAAMHQRHFGNLPQAAGLTLGFMQSRWNGHEAIGHDGDIAGYKTHFVMFPESGISLFIAFNSDQTGDAGARIIDAVARRYLPARQAPASLLFSDVPLQGATEELEGRFVPSRRNNSTIEKLFWPLSLGLTVERKSETEIDVGFVGQHNTFVRAAAGVYVPSEGAPASAVALGALLARKAPDTGETEIFLSGIGSFMFERPAPAEALSRHGSLLMASLGGLGLGALLGIAGMFASRHSRIKLLACMLLTTGSAAMIAFVPLVVSYFTPALVYGVSAEMRTVFLLPPIGAVMIFASAVMCLIALRQQQRARIQLAGIAFAVAGGSVFLWQLHVWNMLGLGGLPS